MRSNIRISLLALVAGAIVAVAAPSAAQAISPGFGVEKFFAGNCGELFEKCGEGAKEGTVVEAESEAFRQDGGHPFFGVTDFKIKTREQTVPLKALVPEGNVQTVRVDVAPGVVTNPQAVPKCSMKDFVSTLNEYESGKFAYNPSKCPASSEIGEETVEIAVEVAANVFKDFTLKGKVYNLEQENGFSSDSGVALSLTPLGIVGLFSHVLIEGNVEWASDYHDYFTIHNISPGLIESRTVYKGHETGYLRNPTACTVPGLETTTKVTVTPSAGQPQNRPYTGLVGTLGCGLEFKPSLSLTPETALSDQPDGLTAKVTATHPVNPSETDTSDLRTATIKFPEGLTMNPSAAAGLQACTPKQIGIGTREPVTCPSASRIGTINLEVPTLPAGSLQGPIFLGNEEKPEGEQIKGPPYTIYLDAESARYGVKVRLNGKVTPNPTTGQLTTTFSENPQAPFNEAILHFNGGAFAPLANPLVCGTGNTQTSFAPFSNTPTLSGELPFTTVGCASSPSPFAPTQSTSTLPPGGGAESNFTFNLTRPEGQQYLEKVKTVLPPGVVGKIPTVPLCTEAQANAGTCSAASLVGTVRVAAGSGEPYPFTGNVYLSGPYQGAPYSLSIVVPIVAGPFNLGTEVTRSKIEVEPKTARVIVTSTLPTIRGGIPTRLRSLTVNLNRPNYILNPTNCGVLATESTLTSTLGATALASSPFQVEGCSSLGFKPSFKATTFGRPSKALGASIETTINQPPGQANIKSVVVRLPARLPSRLSTLQKACPEATFAANPYSCPIGSLVGGARANTPVLPGKMSGPAYLVSHGGAAFPDLDLVLEANGVRVILTGNTDIKKGVTTTSFLTGPDVPISSITTNLPIGPHSALAANGALCGANLVMPTTITGQNGKTVKQNTKIAVAGCGVQIVGHKVIGNTAFLTVQTFSAGRISGSGANLATVYRTLGAAARTATLKVPLTGAGRGRRRPLHTRVRVGFVPRQRGAGSSAAFVNLTFG